MKRFLTLGFVPSSTDAGLLLLRVTVCMSLFIKHGTEKLFTFSQMSAHFPDPLHIGAVPSLAFAMIADGICMPLIVIGLATRWAALISFINLFVAWALVHHFLFLGKGADHGEVVWLYIAGMATLFITGPGRYSIDALLSKESRSSEALQQKFA